MGWPEADEFSILVYLRVSSFWAPSGCFPGTRASRVFSGGFIGMWRCQPCLKGAAGLPGEMMQFERRRDQRTGFGYNVFKGLLDWVTVGETSLKNLSYCLVMQVRSLCEKAKEILMQENNVQVSFCAYYFPLEFFLCQTMTILWQSTNWLWGNLGLNARPKMSHWPSYIPLEVIKQHNVADPDECLWILWGGKNSQ